MYFAIIRCCFEPAGFGERCGLHVMIEISMFNGQQSSFIQVFYCCKENIAPRHMRGLDRENEIPYHSSLDGFVSTVEVFLLIEPNLHRFHNNALGR